MYTIPSCDQLMFSSLLVAYSMMNVISMSYLYEPRHKTRNSFSQSFLPADMGVQNEL